MLTPPKMTVGKTTNKMPAARRDSGLIVYLFLSHADVRHCDLLEKVWRSNRAWRVSRQRLAEFWLTKRLPEVSHRLPDRLVDEHATSADTTMQLGRDKAGLRFEERGVSRPGLY